MITKLLVLAALGLISGRMLRLVQLMGKNPYGLQAYLLEAILLFVLGIACIIVDVI